MTENEKKLLQAKHRKEGAILEKVYPVAAEMDLEKLEDFLLWALR